MSLADLSFLALLLLSIILILKERSATSACLACGTLFLGFLQVTDQSVLRQGGGNAVHLRTLLVLESLLPVVFILYGVLYARRRIVENLLPFGVLFLVAAAFVASAVAVPDAQLGDVLRRSPSGFLSLGAIGSWYHVGLLILFVAALVNLESVFSSIHGVDRWRVKYEFLGVGGILAVFVFTFSQTLLKGGASPDALPVRSAALIAAALLIGYSRLFRGQTRQIVVSRQAFYRSFTLLTVGAYLLLLALLGDGVKYFAFSAGHDFMVVAAFVSFLAFLLLLLSEDLRRRVKVFIAKHFYAHKHDYREEWLRFSQSLAACRSLADVETVIVDSYLKSFGLRHAALYVAAGGGACSLVASRGRDGLPARLPLSTGMLGYFTVTGRTLNPEDGEYSPTSEESAALREAGAWIVVPLLAGDKVEALVLLGRQIVPERLTYEDYDLMKTLGRQAVLSLLNYRLSEELAESRELAAIAKVSSFVVHDLKNLVYSFSLMLDNAERYIGEPAFQHDLVASLRNTVVTMDSLIGKLKAFPGKLELHKCWADLDRIVLEAVTEVRRMKPEVSILGELDPVRCEVDVAELRRVFLNILLNACEASASGGRVQVATGAAGGEVTVRIADEGCGMSEAFVKNLLFRPFRTTKDKGLGIGLYQCRQIVEGHGGRIEVKSEEGRGTAFTVVLPGGGEG